MWSKEVKEGTSSQSKVKAGKVKEGGGCECPTPNGDVIQVCKYKPSHVAKFPNLVTPDLSHNTFSGKIPSSLSYMSYLKTLLLNHNRFTGPIPSGLVSSRPGFEGVPMEQMHRAQH
ncbi:hypothetical protein HID58_079071 [Brassica napus]|uniref:Uncharacterized protein n=1 Tax=Brassica napus TaxID=3708 RepID=A0ABQ7Y111_BRANA|nr:hypothetical protein HID58_079071 [Brassica napus]